MLQALKSIHRDPELADIILTYKKDDNTGKQNYRPINSLPATWKVFERVMDGQPLVVHWEMCFPTRKGIR